MTLRESIQAKINAAQADVTNLQGELAKLEASVSVMLDQDTAALKNCWTTLVKHVESLVS